MSVILNDPKQFIYLLLCIYAMYLFHLGVLTHLYDVSIFMIRRLNGPEPGDGGN